MYAFAYFGFGNILFWRINILNVNIQYMGLEVFEHEPKEKSPQLPNWREVGSHQMEPKTTEDIRWNHSHPPANSKKHDSSFHSSPDSELSTGNSWLPSPLESMHQISSAFFSPLLCCTRAHLSSRVFKTVFGDEAVTTSSLPREAKIINKLATAAYPSFALLTGMNLIFSQLSKMVSWASSKSLKQLGLGALRARRVQNC